MILLKIFNVLFVGLILSTSIVDGKSKTPSKSGSSKSSSSSSNSRTSSSNRQTTSRPMNKQTTRSSNFVKQTTSSSIVKQTSRPLESSKYPTQPPYNPHYQPDHRHPQPDYRHPQPDYRQPQPDYRQPQPDYRPQQVHVNHNFPQQYPHQTQHNSHNWYEKPKKSNVGRNIATHAIAGLGGAYVGHQIGKHSSWYDKKRRERQHERERSHTATKNRTNTFGLDRLKPITPFKVHDISSDPDAARHETGNGFKMMNDVHTRYNNDPQKNEISKAAEANMYLNMKLRPSKSETVPKKNYTTEQLQGLIMSGGGLAVIGGALGAMGGGGAGAMGMGSPAFGPPPSSFNPQPNYGGVPQPGIQPGFVQPGAPVQPGVAFQPGVAVQPGVAGQPGTVSQPVSVSTTFDLNSTNPFVPQVPVVQFQPGQVAQTQTGQVAQVQPGQVAQVHPGQVAQVQPGQVDQSNFIITGGQSILQTNQTQTPYKIPLADPQVLPLVLKQLDSDEKLDKKRLKNNNASHSSTFSTLLILISIVVVKQFNY